MTYNNADDDNADIATVLWTKHGNMLLYIT